jgi:branched-chain amino acid aminotransferase
MSISITPVQKSRVHEVDFANLDFGAEFADHMLDVVFANGAWQTAEIVPYGPVPVLPSLSVFHYGQAVFEGMKAFRHADGRIALFRPEKNFERMCRSCERLAMPVPSKEIFYEGLKELIRLDADWVPKEKYKSLYLRPFMIATDPVIRLQASKTYRFMIITSPVGNYYKEGINPVPLTTVSNYVRAVVGGIGEAKAAGNYAASMKPAREAQQKGYAQVMWLDAKEHRYIEEVGSMNMFFVINNTLVTPQLTGSILPGVTRDSVLHLARQWGMPVEERPVSMDELILAHKKGQLKEAFGAGTAAVISPVGRINHMGEDIVISETMGPVAQRFYTAITDIQFGDAEDRYNWLQFI